MTQEQFYFCLSRILELRLKIEASSAVRRQAHSKESALAKDEQVDFDSLSQLAESKERADKSTAEARALVKELAAQEAKIRAFIPVSYYGTRIEARQPGGPVLYVVVEAQHITIGQETV